VQSQYPTGDPGAGYPGTPGFYPPAAPEPAKRTNGFAVASLIFGIIGGIPLGIIFGIVGLVRAKTYRSGKVMSWIGIVLSVLWIIPVAVVIGIGASHVSKAIDPGCTSARTTLTGMDQKIANDANNADAFKADLQTTISALKDAAAKTKSDKARTAMTNTAADFQALLDSLNSGTQPDANLQSKLDADANSVDKECGAF
jgi:hypothetical protein